MSAQPVLVPSTRPTVEEGRRTLRLVPSPRPQMSRVPFLLVLIGLVGFGMVGLLLLNTGLQNQAFAASQLRQQAAQISYQEGELAQLVIEASSTRELTRKATELGMRPNRGIAFVQVPDGRISGDPAPEDGMFLPSALSKSPEELAKERADRALKRAHERRMAEQKVLLTHRQRLLDARAAERAAAERAAAQAAQPAPQQPAVGGQPAQPDGPPVTNDNDAAGNR
jgi:hypothetical protein